MKRLAGTVGVLIITVLLTGLFPTESVLAGPVDDPKIKAFLLAGRLQSELLNNIGQTFSDMTIKQPRSQLTIFDDIKKFKDMAAQLKGIIGYDQPGREKLTKYYKKANQQQNETVDMASIALLQAHNENGRIDLETAKTLAEEADRVMYRIQELIRHLHADIDLTGMPRPVRMQLAEALLLVQMQGGLLQAVKEAFEETHLRHDRRPPTTSGTAWACFDVNAAVYRTIVDLDDPGNKNQEAPVRLPQAAQARRGHDRRTDVHRQPKGGQGRIDRQPKAGRDQNKKP